MTFLLFLKKRVSWTILFSCFFLSSLSFSRDVLNDFSENIIQEEKADLIAFSFDRPMQLYALLESLEYYVNGIQNIYVICRASNDRYRSAYEQVAEAFSRVTFVWQGENPKADFKMTFSKELIIKIVKGEISGTEEFMKGRIKVQGDFSRGLRYIKLFRVILRFLKENSNKK